MNATGHFGVDLLALPADLRVAFGYFFIVRYDVSNGALHKDQQKNIENIDTMTS